MAVEGTSSRQRSWIVLDADAGPGNLDSVNSHYEWIPNRHVRLTRMSAVIVTAPTVTPPVITAAIRPVAGSSSNAVVVSTFTLPITGTGSAAGDVDYQDVGDVQPAAATLADGSTGYQSPADVTTIEVLPGQSIYFNLATAGSAGSASFGFQIEDDSDLFKTDAHTNKVASKVS